MYSEKTARYAYIPHGWETDITHLKQCSSRMVLYMNVSARGGWLEPEVLWIRRDQAAAPVNLVKVLCNTSYILLILLDIFILFWSVNYIAFKVLLYLYGMLYPNDDNRSHHHSYSLKIEAYPKWFRPDQIAWWNESFQEPSTKNWSDSECNCHHA